MGRGGGGMMMGESTRHDAQALAIGFVGGMAIVVAFSIALCVLCCICNRRYSQDQIDRRKFVNRNIPSKVYHRHTTRNGNVEAEVSTEQERQETALPLDSHDPADGDMCSICLVQFKNRDKISWSTNKECTHLFHTKCVQMWLYVHNDCPMCRKVFLWEDEEEQPDEADEAVSMERTLETVNASSDVEVSATTTDDAKQQDDLEEISV